MLKGLVEYPKKYEECKEEITYEEFVLNDIHKTLSNHDEANYIIMYLRFMVASYLKENVLLYEDFVGGNMS